MPSLSGQSACVSIAQNPCLFAPKFIVKSKPVLQLIVLLFINLSTFCQSNELSELSQAENRILEVIKTKDNYDRIVNDKSVIRKDITRIADSISRLSTLQQEIPKTFPKNIDSRTLKDSLEKQFDFLSYSLDLDQQKLFGALYEKNNYHAEGMERDLAKAFATVMQSDFYQKVLNNVHKIWLNTLLLQNQYKKSFILIARNTTDMEVKRFIIESMLRDWSVIPYHKKIIQDYFGLKELNTFSKNIELEFVELGSLIDQIEKLLLPPNLPELFNASTKCSSYLEKAGDIFLQYCPELIKRSNKYTTFLTSKYKVTTSFNDDNIGQSLFFTTK